MVKPDLFDVHAQFCRVLGDPKRLRIMWLLDDGERSVGELAEALGVTLQNVSQHLRVMRDKGAVTRRKEGQTAYYRIANPKFLAGAKLIREGLREEFGHRVRLVGLER